MTGFLPLAMRVFFFFLPENQVTMVKKKYLNKNTTSVKEIFEILDGYDESGGENLGQRFLLSGYVLGFNETHPNNIFKKLCQSCKSVTGLKNTDDYCCKKVLGIINHFVVYFKDKTTEDTERKLNLYLLTNDGDQVTCFF
jgi:hypothetical protein